MLVARVENTKDFMSQLLKKEVFNSFQVRTLSITTFTTFDINGVLNKPYLDNFNEERNYCLWNELQPYALEIIKGNKSPKHIKIVFSAGNHLINIVSPKASALFININFDENRLIVTSGLSLKTFELDKSIEFIWDEWVNQFFHRNGINFLEIENED